MQNRPGKCLLLDRRDRALLLRCAWVLGAVQLGLRVMSVRDLDAFVTARASRRRRLGASGGESVQRIVWAVRTAARFVPGATCLPRALAARYVMARHGIPSRLRIGMGVAGGGEVTGHAWVESEGRMWLEDGDLTRYTLLPALDAESTRT